MTIPFRCERCARTFGPSAGAVCASCDELLCGRHFGILGALGLPLRPEPVCRRCRRRSGGETSAATERSGGGAASDRMVVIRSYANEFEAGVAAADLEAAGIPVRILSDGVGGVHPHLQFARGVRVAVPGSLAAAAARLLDAPPEDEEEEPAGAP